jgi:hypothetical protein
MGGRKMSDWERVRMEVRHLADLRSNTDNPLSPTTFTRGEFLSV